MRLNVIKRKARERISYWGPFVSILVLVITFIFLVLTLLQNLSCSSIRKTCRHKRILLPTISRTIKSCLYWGHYKIRETLCELIFCLRNSIKWSRAEHKVWRRVCWLDRFVIQIVTFSRSQWNLVRTIFHRGSGKQQVHAADSIIISPSRQ